MRPFHLLQITDCHLGSQPNTELLGMNTDESLYDVLSLLKEQETPDLIVCSGDISGDGGVASYERFLAIMAEQFPNIPLAWLPGNHDDPASMMQVKPLPIENAHKAGGWNLVFLDSKIPREEGGELKPQDLDYLDDLLAASPDLPTLIFLHHQLVDVGSDWVDQYKVKNSEAFFKVVDRYDCVKGIAWGHVHQEFSCERKGVALMATPSTCVQFTPNMIEFQVDHLMPGYRSFNLFPDGTFATEVKRIAQKDYAQDFSATGY